MQNVTIGNLDCNLLSDWIALWVFTLFFHIWREFEKSQATLVLNFLYKQS